MYQRIRPKPRPDDPEGDEAPTIGTGRTKDANAESKPCPTANANCSVVGPLAPTDFIPAKITGPAKGALNVATPVPDPTDGCVLSTKP